MYRAKWSKEKTTGVLTMVMTVAFFIALLWGYSQYQQSRRAFAILENEYQRAYYNYLADVKEMTIVAGKAVSAGALQRSLQLGRLSSLANAAADHMSLLPVQHSRYQRSAAYLNQVGDYAASLGEKLSRGADLPETDQRALSDIHGQLQDIYAQMVEMESAVSEGGIIFASTWQDGGWWQSARQALSGGSRAVQGEAAAAAEASADGFFSRANALLTGVEPLSYDGKYSAHISELPALGLSGLRQASMEEAQKAAETFLSQAGWHNLSLAAADTAAAQSAIPLYSFRFEGDGTAPGDVYVTVSREGGKVVSFLAERAAGTARLPVQAVISGVESLLQTAGYANLTLTSRQALGDDLLLQYVPYENGVICYPDSLTVKVNLDDGLITALNARPYWMNHHQRALPAVLRPAAEAIASLGESARDSSAVLAVIRNSAGGETLCYEIRHTVGGAEYLTYIGAEHLQEEQVLRGYEAADGSFYNR